MNKYEHLTDRLYLANPYFTSCQARDQVELKRYIMPLISVYYQPQDINLCLEYR